MKSTNTAKFKIGIFGSAEGDINKMTTKAKQLGNALTDYDVILLTGAGSGLPTFVASQAYKKNVEVWGYPPCTHLKVYKSLYPKEDRSIYKKMFFVPKIYQFSSDDQICRKFRNITTTATCDAGIIIAGRWGTMNEFTNLHDLGKVIGVLTGTGGIADELPVLYKKINKQSKATVIFESDPKILVKKVMKKLKR